MYISAFLFPAFFRRTHVVSVEPTDSGNGDGGNSYSHQPKAVKIGGGGFVTGIVIHPDSADIMYARTDVGGLYRWDTAEQDWHQLISRESVGQKVSLSVESVALDPNNPNIVYAATGSRGTDSPTVFVSGEIDCQLGVFGSTDSGNTWNQFTDLPNEFLDDVRSVVGDMNDFGRVYLGVGGNGFVYGDLDF